MGNSQIKPGLFEKKERFAVYLLTPSETSYYTNLTKFTKKIDGKSEIFYNLGWNGFTYKPSEMEPLDAEKGLKLTGLCNFFCIDTDNKSEKGKLMEIKADFTEDSWNTFEKSETSKVSDRQMESTMQGEKNIFSKKDSLQIMLYFIIFCISMAIIINAVWGNLPRTMDGVNQICVVKYVLQHGGLMNTTNSVIIEALKNQTIPIQVK